MTENQPAEKEKDLAEAWVIAIEGLLAEAKKPAEKPKEEQKQEGGEQP